MLVRSRMIKNPVTISPIDSLATADARMRAGNFRHLPVVKDGQLLGMLSVNDIRQQGGHLSDTRVTAAMTDDAVTVTPDTRLEDAARILLRRKIGALPVVDNSTLVGILTTTDLLNALVELMGLTEENTCHVDLALEANGEHDLLHALQITRRYGAEVLGIGTYQENLEKQRIHYLVLRSDFGERIADALATNGFSVLGVKR